MDIMKLFMEFVNKTKFSSKEVNLFKNFITESKVKSFEEYYIIEEKITDLDNSCYYLKYRLMNLSISFLSYVNEKSNKEYISIFNRAVLKPIRQRELLKYIQGNDKSINGAADYFNVSDKTIKRDLEELKKSKFNDFNINFNYVIKKNKIVRVDKNGISVTNHPIELNLNMTEVYMLLVDMITRLDKDSSMYLAYKDIMQKIYSQLSDYAKKIIDKHKDKIEYKHVEVEFKSETQIHQHNDITMLITAMKAERYINVFFFYKGERVLKKCCLKSIQRIFYSSMKIWYLKHINVSEQF